MDTITTTHPVCRLARPADDLSLVLKLSPTAYVNLEQVLVAEWHGQVVGVLMLWDAGHSVVYLNHWIVAPDAPKDTGALLMLAANRYCQDHGKTMMIGTTNNLEVAYHATRRGGKVDGPYFQIRYWMRDRRGAAHATSL